MPLTLTALVTFARLVVKLLPESAEFDFPKFVDPEEIFLVST